ncbi:tail fiber protein [Pasteurellaceae bacterium USgator11]|nr:tail fiber protein [Pasteurellaceae bacterium USgator41]TNG96941.1 tail fiber protein [Pasteurellaceae bacterium UScroc12]TNG97855.1 tail fiber protein [Pasteurellaceae bacterium UScroc31]TNH02912.1 tail fiber protein [Pasteurellaceae bacterium USgator11]
MANVKETATWVGGVYQIEPNDSVIGGENGIANRQAKELANRTLYLKTEQDKLKTATEAATTAKTGTTMLSNSTAGTSQAKAATELAAKTAMDRANAAYNLANGKANTSHTHPMSQITDLAPALALKAPLASPVFTGEPTAPTAAQTVNSTQIATTAFVKTAIAALVGSATGTLDTLQEIGAALGNDPNLRTTLLNEIGKKATKATTLAGYGIADFVLKKLTTEDLDAVKVAGSYYRDDNAGATAALHYPEVRAGVLDVSPSTYGWQQEYTTWDTNRKYVRNTVNGGAFTAWKRIDSLDSVGKYGNETITGVKTFNNTLVSAGGYKFYGGGKTDHATLAMGATDVYLMNTSSRKTLQLKDDGSLRYSDKRIYVEGEYEPQASTNKAGITTLSSSTTGTSEDKAATEKAVGDLNRAKANLASPALTGTPTAPTAAQTVNSTQIATTAFVKAAIAALVGGAPAQLDTLKEIATALGNKANLEASLLAEIAKKANSADVVLKTMFIGVPIPYPSATVPAGFLAMTGQTISQTTYPRLYALYGARLPDLRGEFIRGWDNGRNADRGRTILTAQGDAIRNITGEHGVTVVNDNDMVSGVYSKTNNLTKIIGSEARTLNIKSNTNVEIMNVNNTQEYLVFDASAVVPTAADNRPRNIAFNYICLAG